jgi:hypothetical protein
MTEFRCKNCGQKPNVEDSQCGSARGRAETDYEALKTHVPL